MGYGAGVGGAISGIGSAYAAYTASQQAEADREQKRDVWNKDTKLKIAQFNLNQNRLAGLASVLSGARGEARANSGLAQGYSDERAALDATSKAKFQGQGDYSTLKSSDYEIGAPSGGSSISEVLNPYKATKNILGIDQDTTTTAPTYVDDFSGGGTVKAPAPAPAYSMEGDPSAGANTIGIARSATGGSFVDSLFKEQGFKRAGSPTGLTTSTLTAYDAGLGDGEAINKSFLAVQAAKRKAAARPAPVASTVAE